MVLVFSIHVLAVMRTWYFLYPWIDIPLHLAGGFLSALGAYLFLKYRPQWFCIETRNILTPSLLMLGSAALIGIGWEFFEFSYDMIAKPNTISAIAQLGVRDTMGDLFFDLFGACIAIGAFLFSRPRN